MTKPTRLQVEVAAAIASFKVAAFSWREDAEIKAQFGWSSSSIQHFVQGYRLGLAAARRESKRGKGKR